MAFDAKQAVADTLVDLEDKLKQAKVKQEKDAKDNAVEVARLEDEIASWQALIAEPAPVAKKTASKKAGS